MAFDDGSVFIEVYKNCLPHVLFKMFCGEIISKSLTFNLMIELSWLKVKISGSINKGRGHQEENSKDEWSQWLKCIKKNQPKTAVLNLNFFFF